MKPSEKIHVFILHSPLVHIEMQNSKGRSGHIFLPHFTKNFCRFLTPKVKSGTDTINPSIESSDFLFCHKQNFELDF